MKKISENLFGFTQHVAPEGYRIVRPPLYQYSSTLREYWQMDGVELDPPWIISKGKLVGGWTETGYGPDGESQKTLPLLSEYPLHRIFASLKTERLEGEVLGFANKFGLLGIDVLLKTPEHQIEVNGESVLRWQQEIQKIGVALALWDMVRKKDRTRLKDIVLWRQRRRIDQVVIQFKWKSRNGFFEVLPAPEAVPAGMDTLSIVEEALEDGYAYQSHVLINESFPDFPGETAWFHRQYKRGDVVSPARHYLCRLIDHQIVNVSPTLAPSLGYELLFVPHCLLAALWLMLALEVTDTVRTCWHCGCLFEPARKDQVYHSRNCKRMAFYYAKQRKGIDHERPHSQAGQGQL